MFHVPGFIDGLRFTLKRTTTNQFVNSTIGFSLIEQHRLCELFENDYRIQKKGRGPNRIVLYSFRVIRVTHPFMLSLVKQSFFSMSR